MILFLIIHIFLCVLLYFLVRAEFLKCQGMVMTIVWLVPIWGLCCFLILEIRSRGNQEQLEKISIEKLKVNDEVHRSILMEEELPESKIVPLEEALLINNAAARRELLMDIMYADPGNYVQQLQEARMNNDAEVVHYAVTALAELQKEYDIRFQDLDRKLGENPDDDEILDEYLDLAENYLRSGLLEGNTRSVQLHNYSSLIEKKKARKGDDIRLYHKRAEAGLYLEEYETARQEIEKMLSLWPNDEAGYLLMIKYYSALRDRKGIEKTIEIMDKKEIHLSSKGRNAVRFWRD